MGTVVIVDYDLGNVRSIGNALKAAGADPLLSDDHEIIAGAKALVLPGVGSFKKGMENLKRKSLDSTIKKYIKTGKPFLGICLGLQLLFTEGEEFGHTKGLDIIKGSVKKIPVESAKLPHVAWNRAIEPRKGRWNSTILKGIDPENNSFYHTHSFCVFPENEAYVLTYCDYEEVRFCSGIQYQNIIGVQFHPEKSGKLGLYVLSNFLKSF